MRIENDYLDCISGGKHNVLDHGFIRVVDYMGDDSSIVQAARVSYGAGTKKKSEDAALIDYLMRRRHTTPFEMCELKLHLKMPIFVARQWQRHRTASINEYSGRYSEMNTGYYVPKSEDIRTQSSSNKQGGGDRVGDVDGDTVGSCIDEISDISHSQYGQFLSTDISRETARIVLPLNTYTEFYWKIDLHNLLHFLSLRVDPHAQYEIRVYAQVILDIVRGWVPETHKAFMRHVVEGVRLSREQLDVVRRIAGGEDVKQEDVGLGKREWGDLQEVLGNLRKQ